MLVISLAGTDPAAQAGCGVDSPIVASNLKGGEEDRSAGRRRKTEDWEERGSGVKCSAGMDGLTAWS
ncbi:hypothetical protein CgunFtcFv8_016588 [Champsocephalus gunnari]|uniref:Uncharacterized protein n=2 Tax=Channichthyidae TaxID=30806 RepID=A0AAN8CR98_CHAGU|nr:hypothetical protein KUCAC02_024461 [Chaenocephalus aceratus]KAK5908540.1 hypothetical protein CgunFtcFv8_016588 [Champsocephalus gunnari]